MKLISSRSRMFHMMGVGLVVIGLPLVSACNSGGSQSSTNRGYNHNRSQSDTIIMDSNSSAPSKAPSSGYSRYTGSAPAPQPGVGPRVMNAGSQSSSERSQPVKVDSGSTTGIKIPAINKSK